MKKDKNNDLIIYAFNAGKADSFIITKDDKTMIIDTGESSLYPAIDNYLKCSDISKINFLIISHFDKDHVGSASMIIDNYDVDNVLQSNHLKDSIPCNNYLSSIKNKGIEPVTVREITSFNIDDIDITIIPPKKEKYLLSPSNNSSLIVAVKYKSTSYLFTGDIEGPRIEEFIHENILNYDFLKVPYHGHFQKKIGLLIDNVNPKYAVITSSDKRLEDDRVIEILKGCHIETYLTRKGNLVITSDGKNIKVVYE